MLTIFTTIIMKLSQYLKETKNELKEVVFPTTKTTIMFTMIVVILSTLVALTLGGVDLGLREALKHIVSQ